MYLLYSVCRINTDTSFVGTSHLEEGVSFCMLAMQVFSRRRQRTGGSTLESCTDSAMISLPVVEK